MQDEEKVVVDDAMAMQAANRSDQVGRGIIAIYRDMCKRENGVIFNESQSRSRGTSLS
ncbi:hypothetical protein ACLOJK_027523, partial [Asimina triloba]